METPKCPKCQNNKDVVPIGYGLPGPEMSEEAIMGKIRLGGCIIDDSSPDWYCKKCELEFLYLHRSQN